VVRRRSLDDALTPDEEAFLKQEKPAKPQTPKPKSKPQPQKKKESQPMNRSAIKEDFTPDTSSASNSPAQYSLAGTGSVNARIDPLITTALLRASLERRIERQTPTTQRDIIAEALSDWLKKHGYFN
jgi:outer membrane biosynthesis protein TonB